MWRYEIKVALQPYEVITFRSWLASAVDFSRHFPSRFIHSIYLDNQDYGAAKDNIDGLGNRMKARIRWYDQSNNNARLEAKIKQDRLGRKIVSSADISVIKFLELNTNERIKFLSNIDVFNDSISNFKLFHPTIGVHYRREYYISLNKQVRMTVDSEISFEDIISKSASKTASGKIIVEFKFSPTSNHYVSHLFENFPFYPTKNSKYVLGLSMLGRAIYL